MPDRTCLVTDGVNTCGKRMQARDMCSMHYRRWDKTGDPGPVEALRGGRRCSACDEPYYAVGFCERHYRYLRNERAPECSMKRCPKPVHGRGLCDMHLQRLRKHGDPEVVRVPSHYGREDCSYGGAHNRIWHQRGKAHNYSCVDCGRRAQEWSYCYTAGDRELEEFVGEGYLLKYSPDPSDYAPRCKPCHWKFDNQQKEMA